MGRRTALLLALAVLVATAPAVGPAVADPDDARLTIDDVAVSPSTPTTSGPVTFDVSLSNSAGSPSPVELEYVSLRTESGEELRNVTDLGTLSAGDGLTVPLSARFETAGRKRLQLVAVGTDEDNGTVRVTRPVPVTIEAAPPQLDVAPVRAIAETGTTVSVTVSNPTTAPIRNLSLSATGSEMVRIDGTESRPTLAAGESVTVNLSMLPTAAGEQRVRVSLSYTTASGVTDRVNVSRTVRVAPIEPDVGVAVSPVRERQGTQSQGGIGGILASATGAGSTTQQDDDGEAPDAVEVTVTNFGNAPVNGVVVEPRVGDRQLPRQVLGGRLAPGQSGSVTVDLSTVRRPGDVTFTVRYLTGSREEEATATYEYRPETGVIRTTGVALSFEDGTLVIEGNAGNVGEADVSGLVVSVGEGEHVDPAYPARDYFVGTVEASEFAPFEVTADVDAGNVSTIPIVVTYSVDGYRFEERIEVPYDDDLDPSTDEGSGGIPLLPVGIGLVVVLALATGGYVVWRRSGETA